MDIKSINLSQIQSAIGRSPEGSNAKAEALSGPSQETTRVVPALSSSTSFALTCIVQAKTLGDRVDFIKEQLDKVLVDFPPFFPAGTYQRADLIEGIRCIQEDIEKSSLPSAIKKDASSPKLTDNATDHDISAALDKILDFKDRVVKNIPGTVGRMAPGTMVNIRV